MPESLSELKQDGIIEDLLTIKKKSVLKKRLIGHWQIETDRAIDMCFLEFEPDHGNLSLKAINNLLPHLEAGMLYSEDLPFCKESVGYHQGILPRTICHQL